MSAFFHQLLQAAAQQLQPQRLLFVLAAAELPADASAAQRTAHQRGEGGTLSPLMCVDKSPAALSSFAALAEEARQAGPPWDLMFVAALSGQGGDEPAQADVEAAMKRMVERIHQGQIDGLLVLDRLGEPVAFV